MYTSPPQGGGTPTGPAARRKLTAPALRARKGSRPITVVTAYDYTMARLLDEAEVDALLIGDSLGMVVQGLDSTLPVTVDEICYHCRAVARAALHAHVIADMPFMSFQISPEQALENAGRIVKEGAAESVKLEGGLEVADQIDRIVRAGIPVCGHVGLTPQSVHSLGGYRVQGHARHAAERILAGAEAVAQAGAFALVLEAVPPDVAALVTRRIEIPTIGIGAGPSCDGQVLVCYDMLGMNRGHTPRFVKQFAAVGDEVLAATRTFVREVGERAFPDAAHSFRDAGHDDLGRLDKADEGKQVMKLVM